jgi:hypothetical protein
MMEKVRMGVECIRMEVNFMSKKEKMKKVNLMSGNPSSYEDKQKKMKIN